MPSFADGRAAVPGDGAAQALVGALAAGTRRIGRFTLIDWTPPRAAAHGGERTFGVDQTNTSVVVGERAVVKWMRAAEPGPHPAPATLEALRDHGFTGMPQPWGLVLWQADEEEPPRLIATVDELLPGAVDGWTWAVDDVRAAVVSGSDEPVLHSGGRIGTLVADLHAALIDTGRPATAADLAAWQDGAHRDLDQALEVTSGTAHELLAARADAIAAATASALGDELAGSPLILAHGDLHVGQVLRSGEVDVVTDFDGNPVLAPAERTAPQPATLDVACMAQSISHAAIVLRRHEPEHDAARTREASHAFVGAFLDTYAARLGEQGAGALYRPELVPSLRLRQVCREFSYAALHLPRWSYVPEAALVDLLP